MYRQLELVGEGSYGKVYSAEPNVQHKIKIGHDKVAIKYNMTDPTADFIGNIRELDYLYRLKGHPYIVTLIEHIYGFPFDTPCELIDNEEREKLKVKDDQVSFVMPYATCTVEPLLHTGYEKIVKKYDLSWKHYKDIMYQILLGLEYMHSNGILHRDVRSDNVLLFLDPPYARGPVPGYTDVKRKKGRPKKVIETDEASETVSEATTGADTGSGTPVPVLSGLQKELDDYRKDPNLVVAQLVDFGMCKNVDSQGRSTPRTYIDGCRPPEVHLKADYDAKADTWATGIFFYELITGKTWSYKSKKPDEIIAFLLKDLPYFVDLRKSSLAPHVQKYKVKRTDRKNDTRKSWKDKLDEKIDSSSFDESPGTLDQFCDLLGHMIQFSPDTRYSIRECLDHEFFDFAREKIDSVRRDNPSSIVGLPYEIVDCIERDWICKLAMEIFKKRDHIKKWWNPSILFHAIDLYDRYLCIAYKRLDPTKMVETSETRGRLLRQKEAWHKFLCCIYIFLKYFDVMTPIMSYNDMVEGIFTDQEYTRRSLEFEKELISMFDGKLFRVTVYEHIDHQMSTTEMEKLLVVLLKKEVNGMKVEDIEEKAFE